MLHKAWNSKGEMRYCFPRSSINFQCHTGQNITDFDPNWAFPDYRPVAAFKSLRFALFNMVFLKVNLAFILCVIYVRKDNDSSIWFLMIRLAWTTWTPMSAVLKTLLNLITHSLLSSHAAHKWWRPGTCPTNSNSIEFKIHCKFWSNFEFDRNMVSGTGTS